jgi:integrase
MRKSGEGWLRTKEYAGGKTVLFCFYTLRASDGKRVENSRRVGLLKNFSTEKSQWMEVSRLGYPALLIKSIANPTFADLADNFQKNELTKDAGIGGRGSDTADMIKTNLRLHILPRWGKEVALEVSPLTLEAWFESLSATLEWTTIAKLKSNISSVYKHAIRHKLIDMTPDAIPTVLARCKTTTDYEAKVVTPEQMISILEYLDKPETRLEYYLALTCAATALRGNEIFGLQWGDIDWKKGLIHIRRGWSKGHETPGKNEGSMTQVAMHPVLAECLKTWRAETLYKKDGHWLFPSYKNKGKIPRVASCASQDYLRPAAVSAGAIPKEYQGRFGWHTLRHSLATFFADKEVMPDVTRSVLRHKRLATTMEIYTHSINSRQVEAQGKFLEAIKMKPASEAIQ